MFEYELQWMVQPNVCLTNPSELESTPLFKNFGNGPIPWTIKLINNNKCIQLMLVSTPNNGLPAKPFSLTNIKCISLTRTLFELENSSYKTVFMPSCVVYYFTPVSTTLSNLTSQFFHAFKVIVKFSLTAAAVHPQLPSKTLKQIQPDDIGTVLPINSPAAKPLPTEATKLYVFAAENMHTDQILQDYGRLLNDHRHSDFKVIVKDHHFQCHKSILAARCQVFADLIGKNANDHTMTLEANIDVETAADLLSYIYVGRAPNIAKTAERLLVAADTFELNLLKLRCEDQLKLEINVEKALKLLRLTDRVETIELKSKTLDFIRKNLRPLMTKCPTFKDEMVKDPEFFYDLMSQIS